MITSAGAAPVTSAGPAADAAQRATPVVTPAVTPTYRAGYGIVEAIALANPPSATAGRRRRPTQKALRSNG